MSTLRLDPARLLPRELSPPVSKSDAIRALVLAHALEWPELDAQVRALPGPLPADVRVAASGLCGLRGGEKRIDCADGGAPFRFLLAQAAVAPGRRTELFGTPRLGERPHEALFEALEEALGPAGLELARGAPWPVEVVGAAGRAREPRFRVRGAESSQFASALLFAAAALARREGRAWTVELLGAVTSESYLSLSVDWARRCGVPVAREGAALTVGPAARPAELPPLPGDWSSLGYLLLVAWRTGALVRGVDRSAPHPDRAVLGHLEGVGLRVVGEREVRVQGEARGGLLASAKDTPDLILTLAALACALPGPSRFTHVSALAAKESDRLEGALALAAAAGARATVEGDALAIAPAAQRPPLVRLSAQGDHRRAMSAATLAFVLGVPLELEGPECVEKSFPDFWRQLGAGAG